MLKYTHKTQHNELLKIQFKKHQHHLTYSEKLGKIRTYNKTITRDRNMTNAQSATTQNITDQHLATIIKELINASNIYYLEGGESPLTDEEFDAKQAYLTKFEQTHPHLFEKGTEGHSVIGGTVNLGANTPLDQDTIIKHKQPMLSLAKATQETELDTYLDKVRQAGATDFQLQAKLDGLAISAHYTEGKLTLVATRGNGEEGENVTYLATTDNLIVHGLPTTIDNNNTLELRGELFFTAEQFNTTNQHRIATGQASFELSRSAASGIVKRARKGLSHKAELTFGTYSVHQNNTPTELKTIETLPNIITVDQLTKQQAPKAKLTGYKNNTEVHKAITEFGKIRENFTIPTDGVVVKPTNESEMIKLMGNTSSHPSSQIAWKYPSPTAETVILKITATVGKTGRITPVAEFAPVILDGVIERASLHNYSMLAQKDIRVGSTVIVKKALEIIPQVVAVIATPENSEPTEIPTNCPICNTTLTTEDGTNKTLNCENEECPARALQSLLFSVSRNNLDIDRLSTARLTALYENGTVTKLSDLYTLTTETIAETVIGQTADGTPTKIGTKTAAHIINHIEKSKTHPLERLIASLSIPTIGRRASKVIIKTYPTIDQLLNATEEELSELEDFGPTRSKQLYTGLVKRANIIQSMIEHGVQFNPEPTTTTNTTQIDLTNKVFSISGPVPKPFANRNELIDYIEANNGKFQTTPNKTITHMIGDHEGTSSKIKQAKKFEATFITDQQFTEKYTTN